jgi:hypothetical protein
LAPMEETGKRGGQHPPAALPRLLGWRWFKGLSQTWRLA